MHYEEMASRLSHDMSYDDHRSVTIFDELAQALRDGAGYVIITLDPDGIKITAATIPGSSQETIRVKKALRTLRHQIYSGRANGPTS